MIIYSGSVAGASFEPAKSEIARSRLYQHTDKITLIPDPTNEYDPKAIRIYLETDTPSEPGGPNKHIFLGYIPRTTNSKLLAIGLDKVKARFVCFNEFDGRRVGAQIMIEAAPEEEKPQFSMVGRRVILE
jgi:hypothetical protein